MVVRPLQCRTKIVRRSYDGRSMSYDRILDEVVQLPRTTIAQISYDEHRRRTMSCDVVSRGGGGGTLNIYWWSVPRQIQKGGS